MAALTTVFTPPPWCADRFAVFIAGPPSSSTIPPSSGWVDPSFPACIPTQYTEPYPTFSPGVCPGQMTVATSTSGVTDSRTVWTGGCCQSGFSPMSVDPRWLCTSLVTTPMAFLLEPNISTADVYTTLSRLSILHDQVTVQWEPSDLAAFPTAVAARYASMMGTSLSGPGPEATGGSTPSMPAATGSAGRPSGESPSMGPTAAVVATKTELDPHPAGPQTHWPSAADLTLADTKDSSATRPSMTPSSSAARSVGPFALGWLRSLIARVGIHGS